MQKYSRSERMIVLTEKLLDNPYKIFPLKDFTDLLGAAKSTLSEDLNILRETLRIEGTGIIETLAGATGGVRFIPALDTKLRTRVADELCVSLRNKDRIVPGGFIYLNDLIYDPQKMQEVGRIFASKFVKANIDYVITIETKGIPLALMTAKSLGVPLVIVRDESKVTEGSSVSINYVSGSSKRIQTMALARKALPKGAKVLIVDDFMKAGGTAKGLIDLMQEFEAEVVGFAVLIVTAEPKEKLIQDYVALVELKEIAQDGSQIVIQPSTWVKE